MLWSKSSPPLLSSAAYVSTNCGQPAFRVSFRLRQCSTLTGADRFGWSICWWHTNQLCWCRCLSPVSKLESVNVVQRSSTNGMGQIVVVVGTAWHCFTAAKSIVSIVGHTQMEWSSEALPCLVLLLTPANPNHHWLFWRSWAYHHVPPWCLTGILLELQCNGAWIRHTLPSTQWCENRSVALHASQRNVYLLLLATWSRSLYHNDTSYIITPWSRGEFPYRLPWNRQRRATIGLPMSHRKRTMWSTIGHTDFWHSLQPTNPVKLALDQLGPDKVHKSLFQQATTVLDHFWMSLSWWRFRGTFVFLDVLRACPNALVRSAMRPVTFAHASHWRVTMIPSCVGVGAQHAPTGKSWDLSSRPTRSCSWQPQCRHPGVSTCPACLLVWSSQGLSWRSGHFPRETWHWAL